MADTVNTFKDKIIGLGVGGGAIVVLGYLAQIQFEWWSIALVAFFVGCVVGKTPVLSFTFGTAAVTLLWTTYAGILTNANSNLMSDTIGNMFGGTLSGTQLTLFSGIIGGLVGGFAAMAGAQLRELINDRTA